MGSASLFFDLEPKRAILGDINFEVVQCFEQIKLNPRSVHWHLSRFEHGSEFYYELRGQDPNLLSAPRRAARLIYLTRYCFNGLYRTNQAGQFNVPYGGHKTGVLPSLEQLIAASNVLANVSLVCADFETTIDRVKKGDLVYLDPPYWVRGRRRTNQYGPKTFYHDDLTRLREALSTINRRGAHFVLSYEDSEESRAIADPWTTTHLIVRRNVAGFACHRRFELEMLATNVST